MPSNSRRSWLWLVIGVLATAIIGGGAYVAATRWHAPPPEKDQWAMPPEVPEGPAWFRDVTSDSGIDFTYRNGEEANQYTILESVGGGVAMIDYNGDGLLDLFFPGGGHFDGETIKGHPCRLYQNLGKWKFRDVTAEAGLDKIDFYSHGCAVADYDCDGWPDLLVTGYGRVALFRNEVHDKGRRFIETTSKAGINDTSWSTSAAFADLTGKGYPDLYICHYTDWSFSNNPKCKGRGNVERDVCPPQRFKPLVHALFRNNGDRTFRDATKEQRLRDDGCGLGVVVADLNGDARPAIYVANDASNNHLYLSGEGKIDEKARNAGVAVDDNGMYNGSMGVDVADYDRSGRASIFVTNFQGELHALYQNLGRERFHYQSQAVGLAALGRHFVGFGTSFVDIDNDGWEDLVIVNGHVLRQPQGSTLKQLPLVLRNIEWEGRRFFQDYAKRGGAFFATPQIGRGIAIGDLDNDGWPDVVVSHTNSRVALLRNEAANGNTARWLGVKLVGKNHRDIAGSTVTLKTGSGVLTRFAKSGGSYLSASDRRILFGLGTTAKAGRLTVRWAWGKEQHFDNLEPNAYWDLREGDEKAVRVKMP
jgi:enediyne biosynthesis protein E4